MSDCKNMFYEDKDKVWCDYYQAYITTSEYCCGCRKYEEEGYDE
jgi:hypothetical protein